MNEESTTDQIIPVVPGVVDQPENLLDQLALRRKEISETKEVFIPVPGYDKEPPLLLIRYRLLEGPELDRIGNSIRRTFKSRWDRQLYAGVDTFINAVVGVFIDLGNGVPQPLTRNGVPILGFTRELAEGLQFADEIGDPDRPRDVVFGLFANNDVAIAQHNFLLNRWMGDTSVDVSKEFYEGNL